MYTINWNVQTDKKNAKTPLQMCNRSKMVPENIPKTEAVQVQQIKHRNMIHICNSNSALFYMG